MSRQDEKVFGWTQKSLSGENFRVLLCTESPHDGDPKIVGEVSINVVT
jgi:hypothetical protein